MLTTQEKITKIREAVIKANPSIMDLVFGCEIIGPFGKAIILADAKKHKDNIEGERKILGERYSILRGRTASFYNRIAIKEILGRPIGLSDVLLAINNIWKERTKDNPVASKIAIYSDGTIWDDDNTIGMHWNLKYELNDQSDECISFLYQLLIKGE